MNYLFLESEIIRIKQTDPNKICSIKMSLLNRQRKLSYFLEKLIETEELDTSKNTKDVRFYNSRFEEYQTISKLLRVIHAYCE